MSGLLQLAPKQESERAERPEAAATGISARASEGDETDTDGASGGELSVQADEPRSHPADSDGSHAEAADAGSAGRRGGRGGGAEATAANRASLEHAEALVGEVSKLMAGATSAADAVRVVASVDLSSPRNGDAIPLRDGSGAMLAPLTGKNALRAIDLTSAPDAAAAAKAPMNDAATPQKRARGSSQPPPAASPTDEPARGLNHKDAAPPTAPSPPLRAVALLPDARPVFTPPEVLAPLAAAAEWHSLLHFEVVAFAMRAAPRPADLASLHALLSAVRHSLTTAHSLLPAPRVRAYVRD
jgi:hypothetical protein